MGGREARESRTVFWIVSSHADMAGARDGVAPWYSGKEPETAGSGESIHETGDFLRQARARARRLDMIKEPNPDYEGG